DASDQYWFGRLDARLGTIEALVHSDRLASNLRSIWDVCLRGRSSKGVREV
nr:hypothetical protein [Tanacetum cinerariifolium]